MDLQTVWAIGATVTRCSYGRHEARFRRWLAPHVALYECGCGAVNEPISTSKSTAAPVAVFTIAQSPLEN